MTVAKKICMLGDPGVGKTSLVRRYVLDEFTDDYQTTLGVNVYKYEDEIVAEGAVTHFSAYPIRSAVSAHSPGKVSLARSVLARRILGVAD